MTITIPLWLFYLLLVAVSFVAGFVVGGLFSAAAFADLDDDYSTKERCK